MSQTTFKVRMDEQLKNQFEAWCDHYGMDMSTAITFFAMTVVQEQNNPIEVTTSDLFGKTNANRMLDAARKRALDNGTADLSMEDIDEEIAKARQETRVKR